MSTPASSSSPVDTSTPVDLNTLLNEFNLMKIKLNQLEEERALYVNSNILT